MSNACGLCRSQEDTVWSLDVCWPVKVRILPMRSEAVEAVTKTPVTGLVSA